MDTVGKENATCGFALEFHVEKEVVGHLVVGGAVEGCHELGTVGIGVEDGDAAVFDVTVVVHAAGNGGRLAVEFVFEGFSNDGFIVDDDDFDRFHG